MQVSAAVVMEEEEDGPRVSWEAGAIGDGPRACSLAEDVAAAIGEWTRGYGNDAAAHPPRWRHGAGGYGSGARRRRSAAAAMRRGAPAGEAAR